MEDPLLEKSSKQPDGLEVPESMVYFVYMTAFIDTLSGCISTPVMPFYAQSFGVSITWIGYLFGAWSFCAAVFAPMLSGMSDKWGRKFVLVTCLFGAGLANVIQGSALFAPRFGFWIFLFGRGFSGCWASVGAICNVYISDVAPESIRAGYLEKLSMVPIVAILLGPGLGGALAAAFGNNVPIAVDGILTLFSACVVMVYLVETPSFLKLKETYKDPQAGLAIVPQAKVKSAVHVLGVGAFFQSIASSSNLATFSLFFQQRYDMSPLYLGFIFIGMSVSMLLSNMVIVPQLKKKLHPTQSMFLGCTTTGLFIICMGLSENLKVSLATMFLSAIGGAISSSQSATVIASLTEASNRGRIFGILQTYSNAGRIIGPIAATHIAVAGIGVPFCCSGCVSILAAIVYLSVASFMEKPMEVKTSASGARLERGMTSFGEDWVNETGSPADVAAIGKHVSELLEARHYKWISRREEIEHLLDLALPELTVSHREAYEDSIQMMLNCKAFSASVAQVA